MDEHPLIQNFVDHLSALKGIPLTVTERPDKVNRTSKAIDAIAVGNGLRLAIEHTMVCGLPHEKREDQHFMEIAGLLKQELEGRFADAVNLWVPDGVVPKGVNYALREKWRETLKQWLVIAVPSLPYGYGPHRVSGLPFEVYVNKRESKCPRFTVGRPGPTAYVTATDVDKQIRRKLGKLAPYRKLGYQTILLLENDNVNTMGIDRMLNLIEPNLHTIRSLTPDEVWYAGTESSESIEYQLLWSRSGCSGCET